MPTIKANFPSPETWRQRPEISNAGTKGWNPLKYLPEMLWQEIPDLRKFKIGFCSKDEVSLWKSIGWIHMQRQHFEVENFNEAIGIGLGLQDESGVIKFRENYLMIIPKDYHREITELRNNIFEESYERMSRATGTYVDRDDPQADDMEKEAQRSGMYGLEEESFRYEPKKKAGRPKKK